MEAWGEYFKHRSDIKVKVKINYLDIVAVPVRIADSILEVNISVVIVLW